MSQNRITAYLMLTAVAAIWGAALTIIKATLEFFPFVIFLTYRFFLTSLIMIPVLVILYEGKKLLPHLPQNYLLKKDFWLFIFVGLLGSSINLTLLFWGIENTTALSASLIYISTPVLVIATAAAFLKEKVTKQEISGLTLAVLGTLAITLSPTVGQDGKTGTVLGNLIVWASAVTWVAYVLLAKAELKKGVPPLFLVTVSFFVGFLSLLPLALLQTGSLARLLDLVVQQPLGAHLGVWYMALASGALAYWLYQEGQKRIEASEATIFTYLQPLFTAPLALLWLGEKVTIPFLAGASVIVVGVAVAEWKRRKKQKKNP